MRSAAFWPTAFFRSASYWGKGRQKPDAVAARLLLSVTSCMTLKVSWSEVYKLGMALCPLASIKPSEYTLFDVILPENREAGSHLSSIDHSATICTVCLRLCVCVWAFFCVHTNLHNGPPDFLISHPFLQNAPLCEIWPAGKGSLITDWFFWSSQRNFLCTRQWMPWANPYMTTLWMRCRMRPANG